MPNLSELLGLTKKNQLNTLLGVKSPLEDLIKPNDIIDPRIFDKPEPPKKPNVIDRIKGLKEKLKSNKTNTK